MGGWAAILLIDGEKIILTGKALDTTHNRMELTAVLKAIEYVRKNYKEVKAIGLFSDSQYVIGLTARKEKLSKLFFKTKKGDEIKNAELVKELLEHAAYLTIKFVKVKAHQKKNDTVNYNIEVDKLCRKIMRGSLLPFFDRV